MHKIGSCREPDPDGGISIDDQDNHGDGGYYVKMDDPNRKILSVDESTSASSWQLNETTGGGEVDGEHPTGVLGAGAGFPHVSTTEKGSDAAKNENYFSDSGADKDVSSTSSVSLSVEHKVKNMRAGEAAMSVEVANQQMKMNQQHDVSRDETPPSRRRMTISKGEPISRVPSLAPAELGFAAFEEELKDMSPSSLRRQPLRSKSQPPSSAKKRKIDTEEGTVVISQKGRTLATELMATTSVAGTLFSASTASTLHQTESTTSPTQSVLEHATYSHAERETQTALAAPAAVEQQRTQVVETHDQVTERMREPRVGGHQHIFSAEEQVLHTDFLSSAAARVIEMDLDHHANFSSAGPAESSAPQPTARTDSDSHLSPETAGRLSGTCTSSVEDPSRNQKEQDSSSSRTTSSDGGPIPMEVEQVGSSESPAAQPMEVEKDRQNSFEDAFIVLQSLLPQEEAQDLRSQAEEVRADPSDASLLGELKELLGEVLEKPDLSIADNVVLEDALAQLADAIPELDLVCGSAKAVAARLKKFSTEKLTARFAKKLTRAFSDYVSRFPGRAANALALAFPKSEGFIPEWLASLPFCTYAAHLVDAEDPVALQKLFLRTRESLERAEQNAAERVHVRDTLLPELRRASRGLWQDVVAAAPEWASEGMQASLDDPRERAAARKRLAALTGDESLVLTLEDYNRVFLRKEREELKEIVGRWTPKSGLRDVLFVVLNLLKRRESQDCLLDVLRAHVSKQPAFGEVGELVASPKGLFLLVFHHADPELRVKLIQDFALGGHAVPLVRPEWGGRAARGSDQDGDGRLSF